MTREETDWPVKKFTKNNSLFSKLLCLQWAPSFFFFYTLLGWSSSSEISPRWLYILSKTTAHHSSRKYFVETRWVSILQFPSFIEFSSIETFLFPVYVLHTDSHVWFHASLPSYTHTLCTVCTHIQHIHDLRTNTHWHDLEVSDSHPGTVVLKVVVFFNIDSISLLFDAAFDLNLIYAITLIFYSPL